MKRQRLVFFLHKKKMPCRCLKETRSYLERKSRQQCCFRSDTEALPSLLSNIPDDLIWQRGCHGNRPELSDYCRGSSPETGRPLSAVSSHRSLSHYFTHFVKRVYIFFGNPEKRTTPLLAQQPEVHTRRELSKRASPSNGAATFYSTELSFVSEVAILRQTFAKKPMIKLA